MLLGHQGHRTPDTAKVGTEIPPEAMAAREATPTPRDIRTGNFAQASAATTARDRNGTFFARPRQMLTYPRRGF